VGGAPPAANLCFVRFVTFCFALLGVYGILEPPAGELHAAAFQKGDA
jgi:hypothetical protein